MIAPASLPIIVAEHPNSLAISDEAAQAIAALLLDAVGCENHQEADAEQQAAGGQA